MEMTAELSLKDQFLENFSKVEDAFATQRNAAQEALNALDFPTRKDEHWKYTPVNQLLQGSFINSEAAITNIDDYKIPGLDAKYLVFINGQFNEGLSDETIGDDLKITSIKNAAQDQRFNSIAKQEDVFTALNTSYFTDGAYISLSAKAVVEQPIHILNIATEEKAYIQSRNLIVADKHSEVQITESFHAPQSVFINSLSEIYVSENAKVQHEKIQNNQASHISREAVYQEQNSTYSINTITLNGTLVRNDLNIQVDGSNCETNLNGFYLLNGEQLVDNHTVVDHLKAHCESNELYKGIIADQATGVFNGKVFVRQDAQKINAFQSNANILLSDDAEMNSKPELEIYADDVKCSHGSTTGQLDEESVFYLRSRGLSEQSAVRLLLHAFAGEVLEHIENEAVQTYVEQLVNEKLAQQ